MKNKSDNKELLELLRSMVFNACRIRLSPKRDIYGLTFSHRNALFYLNNYPGIGLKQLSEMLRLTRPSMSKLANSLENKDYIGNMKKLMIPTIVLGIILLGSALVFPEVSSKQEPIQSFETSKIIKQSTSKIKQNYENKLSSTVVINARFGKGLGKFGHKKLVEGEIREIIPSFLVLDAANNIYVLDGVNECVQQFNSDGKAVDIFIIEGGETNEFYGYGDQSITFVADSKGNLYIQSDSGIFEKKQNDKEIRLAINRNDLVKKGFDPQTEFYLLPPDDDGNLFIYSYNDGNTYKVKDLNIFKLEIYNRGEKGRNEFTYEITSISRGKNGDTMVIRDKKGKIFNKISIEPPIGLKEKIFNYNAIFLSTDKKDNVYIKVSLIIIRDSSYKGPDYPIEYIYEYNPNGQLIMTFQIPYGERFYVHNDGDIYQMIKVNENLQILRYRKEK